MAPGTKCMEKLEKLLRNQVRRLPEEDCVEYGDLAALEVHLHLLWQGQDEEAGHWHLEVSVFLRFLSSHLNLQVQRQELPDPGDWTCLHLHHYRRSFHQVNIFFQSFHQVNNFFLFKSFLFILATALCVPVPEQGSWHKITLR